MMNKIASDAYSQGAYEALSQLNIPGHIKQAAVQYLVKLSAESPFQIGPGGGVSVTPQGGMDLHIPATDPHTPSPITIEPGGKIKGAPSLSRLEKLKLLGTRYLPKGLAGRSALGAGVLGLGGAAAYGLGAFDEDEGLSNAQIAAMLGVGVGGAGLAAHQAGLLG